METVHWYLNEKKSKSNWARGLRVAAILLGAAGTLIPPLNLANNQVLDVRWGYVALALAAAAVALDRFFGSSSGWRHYLITSFRLQRLLADFQLEWATRSARLEGSTPEPEQVTELLALLRKVLSAILQEVEQETISWAQEFQSNVGSIDRNLQLTRWRPARPAHQVSEPENLHGFLAQRGRFPPTWRQATHEDGSY